MFIVMIPNYWGRGETIEAAANAARKVAGKKKAKSLPVPRIVFQYDPNKTEKAYVNDMGMLCWVGDRPIVVEDIQK